MKPALSPDVPSHEDDAVAPDHDESRAESNGPAVVAAEHDDVADGVQR